jgi:hypothetical protein
MNQEEIVSVLNSKFVDSNNDKTYSILINGPWGVGKSYAWSIFESKYKDVKKIIHISLFGHDSISSIRQTIRLKRFFLMLEIQDKLDGESSFKRGIRNASFGLSKLADQLIKKNLGVSIDPLSLVPLQFGKDYLICFDDLERKSAKIEILDILGLIEEIRLDCNILIIANEEELSEADKDKFKKFKEKVINKTYTIDKVSDKAIINIIDKNLGQEYKYSDLIKSIFNSYSNNNLRTLEKIADFIRELSEYTNLELNDQLVQLCSAIVIEDIKSHAKKALKQNEETKTKPELWKDDLCTKYFIPFEVKSVQEEVTNFYKFNNIDVRKLKEYLDPTPAREDTKILIHFQNSIFNNEENIRADIDRLINELKQGNYDFFQSYERVILLFFYIKHIKESLLVDLAIDLDELESIALSTIEQLVNNTLVSELNPLGILEMTLSLKPEIAKSLIDKVEKMIYRRKSISDTELFKALLQNNDNKGCLAVLFQGHVDNAVALEIFNKLVEPCDMKYFEFTTQAYRYLRRNLQSKDIVKHKLQSLYDSTNDRLVQTRLNKFLIEDAY